MHIVSGGLQDAGTARIRVAPECFVGLASTFVEVQVTEQTSVLGRLCVGAQLRGGELAIDPTVVLAGSQEDATACWKAVSRRTAIIGSTTSVGMVAESAVVNADAVFLRPTAACLAASPANHLLIARLRTALRGCALRPGAYVWLDETRTLAGVVVDIVSGCSASSTATATATATTHLVTAHTRFALVSSASATSAAKHETPPPAHSPLPGLDDTFDMLVELIELPLKRREALAHLRLACPRGILLHGPPGCGKTSLARAAAAKCGAQLLQVTAADILGRHTGESEAALRRAFASAERVSASGFPCVLLLDELDALCPQRSSDDQHAARVVAQLLTLMDGLQSTASRLPYVVVATTNRVHSIDRALRRPGRFEREVAVDVPSTSARAAILAHRCAPLTLDPTTVCLRELAEVTPGFVGADLVALVRTAALHAVQHRRQLVTRDDFEVALLATTPSGRRDGSMITHVRAHDSTTAWDDIGGYALVKQALQRAVEWPLRYAATYTRLGLRPPRGILLHGPPGCSKTSLARALASTASCSFFTLSAAQVFSPFVGDAERCVREAFERARRNAPAVLFFDEIDAVAGATRASAGDADGGAQVQQRVLSTLLNEMDGVVGNASVLVVAATNRRDALDSALVRAGRIDGVFEVALPDEPTRLAILRVHTRAMPLAPAVSLEEVARQSAGKSGADLESICREAAVAALRESINATLVEQRHFMCPVPNHVRK